MSAEGDKPGAPEGKRLKWEPAALMVLVLGLGFWIAFGPPSKPKFELRPGAVTTDIRVGETRGVLEVVREADGTPTFRAIFRNGRPSSVLSREQAELAYTPEVVSDLLTPRNNWFFSKLNVTSWVGVTWVLIGLTGQLLFSGRMFLQWLVSERASKSVVTESFWWFSLLGGLMLFTYAVWRQDPVIMLGQASGIVIYARNLRLIHKTKRRTRREELLRETEAVAVQQGASR